MEIYELTDSGWEEISCEIKGSYAECEITGDKAYLSIQTYENQTIPSWLLYAGGAAVLFLLFLFTVVKRRHRKLAEMPKDSV